jgi:hypothetical protein
MAKDKHPAPQRTEAQPANRFDPPETPSTAAEAVEAATETASQETRNRADKGKPDKAKGAGRDADHDREVALDAAVHWGTTMGKDTGNPQAPDAIVAAAKQFYAFLQASDGRG